MELFIAVLRPCNFRRENKVGVAMLDSGESDAKECAQHSKRKHVDTSMTSGYRHGNLLELFLDKSFYSNEKRSGCYVNVRCEVP